MRQNEIDLKGKSYISSKRAAEITGYTNDYIGQLARANKIKAKMIGRTWFVETNSILEYKGENKLKAEKNDFLPSSYISKLPILFKNKALLTLSIFVLITLLTIPTATFLAQRNGTQTPVAMAKESATSYFSAIADVADVWKENTVTLSTSYGRLQT